MVRQYTDRVDLSNDEWAISSACFRATNWWSKTASGGGFRSRSDLEGGGCSGPASRPIEYRLPAVVPGTGGLTNCLSPDPPRGAHQSSAVIGFKPIPDADGRTTLGPSGDDGFGCPSDAPIRRFGQLQDRVFVHALRHVRR